MLEELLTSSKVQLQTHQQVNRVDLAKRIDIPSKSMDALNPVIHWWTNVRHDAYHSNPSITTFQSAIGCHFPLQTSKKQLSNTCHKKQHPISLVSWFKRKNNGAINFKQNTHKERRQWFQTNCLCLATQLNTRSPWKPPPFPLAATAGNPPRNFPTLRRSLYSST